MSNEKKSRLCKVMFNSIFSDPAIFCSPFRSMNNLIHQKNDLWKADAIVFKFKII